MRCAICEENFKRPKLLSCGHTFCLDCLNKTLSSFKDQDWVVCSVCQKKMAIPKNGMTNFMTNYFVDSAMALSICQVCEHKASYLKMCNACGIELCKSCLSYHCKGQNIGRNKCVEPNSEGYERQVKMLRNISKTIYCGTMEFSFYSAQKVCIEKILPLQKDESWILTSNSQEIVHYNKRGQRLSSISIPQRIADFCKQNDNSWLILCSDAKSLYLYKNAEAMQIVEMVDHYPWRLLSLGCSLVIAATTDTADCKLLFYDDAFTQICSYDKTEVEPVEHISAMCYKVNTRTICLADEASGCVRMIKEKDAPVTYVNKLQIPICDRGGSSSNDQNSGFKPRSLCCDSEGNLCVYDDASGMILIVDSEAKLVGIMLLDEECRRTTINHITFDRNGKLWLGDGSSGKVRVYTVDKACNDLDQDVIPVNTNSQTGHPTIIHEEGEKSSSGKAEYLPPSSQEDTQGMPNFITKRERSSHNSSKISPVEKSHDALPKGSDITTYNQYNDDYKIPDKNDLNKELPSKQAPKAENPFRRTHSTITTKENSHFEMQNTFGSQRTITISVPMGVNGTPLSNEEYDQVMRSGSFGVGTQRSTGSLSMGSLGMYLSLPPHILSNPNVKQYVLKKLANETGISEERLASSLKTPKLKQ